MEVLEQSFEPTHSPTTRVILRTGLLASTVLIDCGLHQERELQERNWRALAATPDGPALYALLGALYERAGLRQQATSAYQEAQLLMDAGRPSPPAPR